MNINRGKVNAPRLPSSAASVHLDAIRGLSAALVFLQHFRYLLFTDYEHVQIKSFFSNACYYCCGFGHAAVIVFFVLSGYLISSSINRAVNEGRWSWGWYAEQRLTRLYVVLLPAMVLGLVWDNLGLHLFGLTGPYSGGREFMFMQPYPITNHISTLTWTGNLLFLQGIKCSVYGSNGPLWSLSYEFWYYVIFALGVSALDKGQRTIHKVIYALLACWLLFFVGRSIDEYFIIWLLGALVGLQNTKNLRRITDCRWKRFLAGSFGIIFFSVCMVVERGHFYSLIKQQIFADLALACSIWFLLVVILNTASRLPNRYYSDAAQFTSRFSYTLYLVHAPILVFLAAYLFGAGQRWQPDPKHFMEAGAFGLVVLAYSLLIWRLTEANTEVVRNRINSFCNNIAATRKR